MRPTFVGFETARRGIMANQKAIDVTGNNLSNINTPGYTRQRVDFVSVSSFGTSSRFANRQLDKTGQGVGMNGVSQIRDTFLDKRFREEFCDVGYYDQTNAILSDIEAAVNEQSNNGLKSSLEDFMKSLQTLNNSPDQAEYANIVLTSAKSLTQVLHQFDKKLNDIEKQQKFELGIAEKDVNSILSQLAQLNKTISQDISYSSQGQLHNQMYGPNELLDKQNSLIDDLSRYAKLDVKRNSDNTVTVEVAGKVAVDGDKASSIEVVNNSDKHTVSITWQDTGKDVNLTTGSLKAFYDMINGNGQHAGQTITKHDTLEKGIPYYKTKIDLFARTFANTMNNILPIKDTDGNPTGEYKKLFDIKGNYPLLGAGNIDINQEWEKKPAYMINDIMVEGKVDNSYISKMISSFKSDKHNFGEFKGSFEEYVNFYNISVGQQIEGISGRLNATVEIADKILDSRDSVSGVSQDEEGVNLMIYDKAFKASSRLMTVLDEALDVIINRTGLIGR